MKRRSIPLLAFLFLLPCATRAQIQPVRGPLASMPIALLFDDGTGAATEIFIKYGDVSHHVSVLGAPPLASTPVADYRMVTLSAAFLSAVDPGNELPLGTKLSIISISTGNDTLAARYNTQTSAFEFVPNLSGGWTAISVTVGPDVVSTQWLSQQHQTETGSAGEILTAFVEGSVLPQAVEGQTATTPVVYQEHSAEIFSPAGGLNAIPTWEDSKVNIIGMDAGLPMVYQRKGVPDPLIMPNVQDIFFTLSPAFREDLRRENLPVGGQTASSATIYRMTWNPMSASWGAPGIERDWASLGLGPDSVIDAISVGPNLLDSAVSNIADDENIVLFSHDGTNLAGAASTYAQVMMAATTTSPSPTTVRILPPLSIPSNDTPVELFDLGFSDPITGLCDRDPKEARFAPTNWSSPFVEVNPAPGWEPENPPQAVHLSLSRIITGRTPRIDVALSGWGGEPPRNVTVELLWGESTGTPASYMSPGSPIQLGTRSMSEFNKRFEIPLDTTEFGTIKAQVRMLDLGGRPAGASYPVVIRIIE